MARAVESFSELTLKGSQLHPVEPLHGSREQTPEYTRELWQLRWRPNDPIDLWVILPRGVKNPPVVLYLYSFPSETDRFRSDAFCKRVVHGGAAAVGFVSAFTGHRTDYHPMRMNLVNQMPEALATTVHDVHLILDYLESRKDLDMSRAGIFGQGSGASIAILSASVDPRLKALDLLDPWGDWPEWFASTPMLAEDARAKFLKPDFQKALEPLEPLRTLPLLASQKLRIQFADEAAPKQATDRIAAAAPAQAQVVRYESSRQMYEKNSGGALFAWIATQLGAHPAPPQSNPVPPSQTAPAAAAPAKSTP